MGIDFNRSKVRFEEIGVGDRESRGKLSKFLNRTASISPSTLAVT